MVGKPAGNITGLEEAASSPHGPLYSLARGPWPTKRKLRFSITLGVTLLWSPEDDPPGRLPQSFVRRLLPPGPSERPAGDLAPSGKVPRRMVATGHAGLSQRAFLPRRLSASC